MSVVYAYICRNNLLIRLVVHSPKWAENYYPRHLTYSVEIWPRIAWRRPALPLEACEGWRHYVALEDAGFSRYPKLTIFICLFFLDFYTLMDLTASLQLEGPIYSFLWRFPISVYLIFIILVLIFFCINCYGFNNDSFEKYIFLSLSNNNCI